MSDNDNMKWHKRWLKAAQFFAGWSKDPSTKVGCVIVNRRKQVAHGYNGPGSFDEDAQASWDRDEKIGRTIHAEMNALLQCDIPQDERASCVVYSTFEPCDNCMKHMLQYGFRKFVTIEPPAAARVRWAESFERSARMRRMAGAHLTVFDPKVLDVREDDAAERDPGSEGLGRDQR